MKGQIGVGALGETHGKHGLELEAIEPRTIHAETVVESDHCRIVLSRHLEDVADPAPASELAQAKAALMLAVGDAVDPTLLTVLVANVELAARVEQGREDEARVTALVAKMCGGHA